MKSSIYRTLSVLFTLFVVGVHGRRLPNIYWNSSSSIFDISNTDHVIPVEIGDQVSIMCPDPGTNYEYSSLYLVTSEEYVHCSLLPSARLLGACMDPSQSTSLSIVFRKYSPLPGGMEFQPGQTYYVVSTSDGTKEGMDNRKGGLCDNAQMKIKFEVDLDRHHHKSTRHDERSFHPKAAARTIERVYPDGSTVFPDDTTPVLYIIQENPDDDGSSTSFTLLPLLLLISVFLRY